MEEKSSNEILLEILNILGIKKYKIKHDQLSTLCLNPDHDDKTLGSFNIDLHTGMFNCFSCHYHGNIVVLLASRGVNYSQAIRLWNWTKRETEILKPFKPLDEYFVNSFVEKGLSKYAQNRVKDDNILNEYNVVSDGFDNPVFLTKNTRKQFDSAWIRENGNYFLIEPSTAKANGTFFGIHLPPTEYTVLTEGPFDSMAVRKYSGERSISGFGTHLSHSQLTTLRNISNLVIFMDGDRAGRTARDILTGYLGGKGDLYIAGGYLLDPDELGEQIPDILNKKVSVAEYQLNKLVRK